jgi:hypothetical protein
VTDRGVGDGYGLEKMKEGGKKGEGEVGKEDRRGKRWERREREL